MGHKDLEGIGMTDICPRPINERVAMLEQWVKDHDNRHDRDADALLLAVRNEIALSAASANPIGAMVKYVAGLVALILVALLTWLLKGR
jgi:hypothetical protein